MLMYENRVEEGPVLNFGQKKVPYRAISMCNCLR